MFDTVDQILRQLRAGEDSRAKFKRVDFKGRRILGPDRDNVAAGLGAFANAEGGTFFLGVDDSGTAPGVPREKLDLVEQWVVNIATDLCDPPIRPVLRRAVVPGPSGDVMIVLAEIRRGLYVHRTSRGRYHLRVGSTRRDLDPTELARLFQDRSREFLFDERKVFAATDDDLSRTRLEAHFGISPTIPWPDLLRNTRVTIRDRDEVDRPSVAGLLSFGRDPTDTRWRAGSTHTARRRRGGAGDTCGTPGRQSEVSRLGINHPKSLAALPDPSDHGGLHAVHRVPGKAPSMNAGTTTSTQGGESENGDTKKQRGDTSTIYRHPWQRFRKSILCSIIGLDCRMG